MAKRRLTIWGLTALSVLVAAGIDLAQQKAPALPAAPTAAAVESEKALVKQYCSGCHNDKVKSGGMTLTKLDLEHPGQTVDVE